MPDTPITPRKGYSALRRGRVSLSGHMYHVTSATFERYPFFTDFRVARLAIRALQGPGVCADSEVLAWTLMPDHLHMLLQLGQTDALPRLLERIKSATARAVNRHLGRSGGVWQPGYHERLLRRDEDLAVVARYVVGNALRAGLVRKTGDYPHWDAVWIEE